jgi:hypothetical protein
MAVGFKQTIGGHIQTMQKSTFEEKMFQDQFYLDVFMYQISVAIREVQGCQSCAVRRIKDILSKMSPEDPDIFSNLSKAVDVGMDSPSRFAQFCRVALDKVEKNLDIARTKKNV